MVSRLQQKRVRRKLVKLHLTSLQEQKRTYILTAHSESSTNMVRFSLTHTLREEYVRNYSIYISPETAINTIQQTPNEPIICHSSHCIRYHCTFPLYPMHLFLKIFTISRKADAGKICLVRLETHRVPHRVSIQKELYSPFIQVQKHRDHIIRCKSSRKMRC